MVADIIWKINEDFAQLISRGNLLDRIARILL